MAANCYMWDPQTMAKLVQITQITIYDILWYIADRSIIVNGIASRTMVYYDTYIMVYRCIISVHSRYTLWKFNISMENDQFIDNFPIKTSIIRDFPWLC